MKRSGEDAAYIWVTETAEWDAFRRVAEIDTVPDIQPARYLYRTVFALQPAENVTDREIARYFHFDDFASITREYVMEFVEEVKTLWAPVAGDEPPPGWDEGDY